MGKPRKKENKTRAKGNKKLAKEQNSKTDINQKKQHVITLPLPPPNIYLHMPPNQSLSCSHTNTGQLPPTTIIYWPSPSTLRYQYNKHLSTSRNATKFLVFTLPLSATSSPDSPTWLSISNQVLCEQTWCRFQ